MQKRLSNLALNINPELKNAFMQRAQNVSQQEKQSREEEKNGEEKSERLGKKKKKEMSSTTLISVLKYPKSNPKENIATHTHLHVCL